MIVVSIECSHKRGMGHFYRALNIRQYLGAAGEGAVIVLNDDKRAVQILESISVIYEIVDYSDITTNWEKTIIRKHGADVWLSDKFSTGVELARHVKNEGVLLAAIDDCGEGADYVDLHFCAMLFHNLRGRHIYSGKEYMILNPEIARYRRRRTALNKILVTLGGSDTYGVTVKVVKILKEKGLKADIVTGPDFQHSDELKREAGTEFKVYTAVPSLIEKFFEYDLAITGGGVTCFEANASGLPCIIIANEVHEIENARYIAGYGGAKFAGYYKDICQDSIDIRNINIKRMSMAALAAFSLNGMKNIYHVIEGYRKHYAG